MAIPSGSGTEVLKRSAKIGLNATNYDLITGVANHIYTIISIIICEQSNSATTFDLRIDDGTEYNLTQNVAIGARQTYVWNDKFVISGTDKLNIYTAGSNVDIHCSYIDQDWT